MTDLDKVIRVVLVIQNYAWNYGHDNSGTAIDVKLVMLNLLKYFKHLNHAQTKLLDELLLEEDDLKYGKKLCSKANKSIRHYIVTLK